MTGLLLLCALAAEEDGSPHLRSPSASQLPCKRFAESHWLSLIFDTTKSGASGTTDRPESSQAEADSSKGRSRRRALDLWHNIPQQGSSSLSASRQAHQFSRTSQGSWQP